MKRSRQGNCPPKAVLIRAHAPRGHSQNQETGAKKTQTCARKTHPCLLRLAPAGTALVPAKTKRCRICSPGTPTKGSDRACVRARVRGRLWECACSPQATVSEQRAGARNGSRT